MTASPSDILLKIVLMAGAFCCAALLLRDGLAIGLHVPLDPNEGWNAYHAAAAVSGQTLYPHGLMANNYPPLSFYAIGILGKSLGDTIVAGRLVSMVCFAALAMGLAVLVRQSGGAVLGGIFAALVFAGALLITSDYVAMDDPQMLGHALQIEALLLLLRERPVTALSALLFAAGLFVKQNLIALPLAALIWLILYHRKDALWFAIFGLGFGILGAAATWVLQDANLLTELTAPRLWRLANLSAALETYLPWAGLPLLLTGWACWRWRRDPWIGFCALYAGLALTIGIAFSAGDGVDANIFFDLDIALGLAAGLVLGRLPQAGRGLFALAYALPLGLFLARNFTDANFTYSEIFQRQAPADIAFIEIKRGPALCEMLSLCYWAGKGDPVDVFNMSEQIQTGARSAAPLARLMRERHFAVIQVSSLKDFALGSDVGAAMRAAYRVDHIDDNGAFLVPRP